MKMPGFTAEASLYKIDDRYHGVFTAPIDGMQVLPQYSPCHWVCLITCGLRTGCHKICHWVCGDPIYGLM